MPTKDKKNKYFLNLQVNFCPWDMVLFSTIKQRQHRKPSDSYRFILILLFKLSVYFLAGSWLISVLCLNPLTLSIVTWMVTSYS